ncbi:MAG TPA: F0F1 ATP synthase subunit epsilon [Candidatus Eisenbacteria bacterium]|jgi:F-type H+-transporting ATPase subunit epsilon|nr:F0F1 ATP synthase subunit epsilon [Candidatus Eisenbacteria bacterium]
MLPDSIELIIVTPERQLLREKVVEVTLPGADGQLGVLPGHAPLITELGIGELTYRGQGGSEGTLAIISGFSEVLGGRVTVLAETAERPEEIDLSRAEEAKKRAEERLAAAASDPEIDWARAAIALQRSLIRIQVARKQSRVRVGQ